MWGKDKQKKPVSCDTSGDRSRIMWQEKGTNVERDTPFPSALVYSLSGLWIGRQVGEELSMCSFPSGRDILRVCWALSQSLFI